MLLKCSNLTPIVYGAVLLLSRPVFSDDFTFDTCDLAVGRLQKDYWVPHKSVKVNVRPAYKKNDDSCVFIQQARIYEGENECTNGSAIGCSADIPAQIERWMEVTNDGPVSKKISNVRIWHCKAAKVIEKAKIPKGCRWDGIAEEDTIERCCGAPRDYDVDDRSILLVKDTKTPYLDGNKEVRIDNNWDKFAKHSFYPFYNEELGIQGNTRHTCAQKGGKC